MKRRNQRRRSTQKMLRNLEQDRLELLAYKFHQCGVLAERVNETFANMAEVFERVADNINRAFDARL